MAKFTVHGPHQHDVEADEYQLRDGYFWFYGPSKTKVLTVQASRVFWVDREDDAQTP